MNLAENAAGHLKQRLGCDDITAWRTLAELGEVHHATPLRWRKHRNNGGRDGRIPGKIMDRIVKNAGKRSLKFTIDDFYTRPDTPIGVAKPGRPRSKGL